MTRLAAALSVPFLLLSLLASTVRAQAGPPRRPGLERQVVVQLAYTLGEAHALRRLCEGPNDAVWYARMQTLETQEASDPASRRQLVESFNAGFAARQAQFAACSRRSRLTEQAVAARGRSLAQQLAASPAEGGGEPPP